MYRTFHEFPTLKNTVEVLHKQLMKNDKQIAFTKLRSFQLFSGKFVTIIEYPKPISWNV